MFIFTINSIINFINLEQIMNLLSIEIENFDFIAMVKFMIFLAIIMQVILINSMCSINLFINSNQVSRFTLTIRLKHYLNLIS